MTSTRAPSTLQHLPTASWMHREPVRGGAPEPRLLALSGLEGMRAAWGRRIPAPPIHHLLGLRPVTIGPATVSFTMPTSPRLYSDAGVLHAGTAALAGAVQATLPPGVMVATSDLSLNFLRPVDVDSGRLLARARPIEVRNPVRTGRGPDRGRPRSPDRPRDHPLLCAPHDGAGDGGDLPELEQPNYSTPDRYQRPAPPPLARAWGERTFVAVVAAKRRGALPLAPCSELLGCHDPAAEEGMAALSLTATPWLASPAGTVYGGVLALLADIVLTGAVATTLPPRTICSPLDLKVQFVRPVWPEGRRLRATAMVAHRGRGYATAHAKIAGEDGTTVALARSSLVIVEGRSSGSLAVANDTPVERDPLATRPTRHAAADQDHARGGRRPRRRPMARR